LIELPSVTSTLISCHYILNSKYYYKARTRRFIIISPVLYSAYSCHPKAFIRSISFLFSFQSDHLSIEKLLVHTIHIRSLAKLKVNTFSLDFDNDQ